MSKTKKARGEPLLYVVQRCEIFKAFAMRCRGPEDLCQKIAVEETAKLYSVPIDLVQAYLDRGKTERLTGYIPARTWSAFLGKVVVYGELFKDERIGSAELYEKFEGFWLRRNQDADFAPSPKVLGRCLTFSGFKRVKVRTRWFWQGLAFRKENDSCSPYPKPKSF